IRGASVLLVEDNVFSQQVGQELLEDAGATVCVANNGREALDLLEKEHFDCVLMDIQMPVMDGYETTRQIRANPRLAGMLVIAMTANAGREDQQRCIDAGMDEFVTKPIAPKQLFDMLARWMSQRALHQAAQAAQVAAPAAAAQNAILAALEAAAQPAPAAALPPHAELVDVAALAQTFNGNRQKMHKFAALFLRTARDSMAELDAALAAGDLRQLSELGHRIKSSARAVGAMPFGELCLALEHIQRDGDLARAGALVAALHAMLERLDQHMLSDLAAHAAG
ncbi:MAG: response regulator, partial [Sphingomonadaceae bacterium]